MKECKSIQMDSLHQREILYGMCKDFFNGLDKFHFTKKKFILLYAFGLITFWLK